MFCFKVHKSGNDVLVAACDKEILGKTFSDGNLQLEVKASFYGDSVSGLKDLTEVLSEATIANLAGNRVVEKAVSEGLIDERSVLVIGGVKHAQFVVMV